MEIEIKEIRKRDYGKAIRFAVIGMHFNWYVDNKFLLNIYGRYFWYLEMGRATQVLAAYAQDELEGVLLADIKGEEKKYHSLGKRLFVKIIDILLGIFYKGGTGVYEATNREMFAEYTQNNIPDGEIIFLAANPDGRLKGVGSMLLREFERRERGKKIYLFTDHACTYQFYEHRGFERSCERDVELDMGSKKVPLKCLLYSKVTG